MDAAAPAKNVVTVPASREAAGVEEEEEPVRLGL